MILRELVKENIIQRGEFKLKSNQTSNIYINLKNIISFPKLNPNSLANCL